MRHLSSIFDMFRLLYAVLSRHLSSIFDMFRLLYAVLSRHLSSIFDMFRLLYAVLSRHLSSIFDMFRLLYAVLSRHEACPCMSMLQCSRDVVPCQQILFCGVPLGILCGNDARLPSVSQQAPHSSSSHKHQLLQRHTKMHAYLTAVRG